MIKTILTVVLAFGMISATFGQSISKTYYGKFVGDEIIEMKNEADFLYNEFNKTVQITYTNGKTFYKEPINITKVIKKRNFIAFQYEVDGMIYYMIMKEGMLYLPTIIDGVVWDNMKFVSDS